MNIQWTRDELIVYTTYIRNYKLQIENPSGSNFFYTKIYFLSNPDSKIWDLVGGLEEFDSLDKAKKNLEKLIKNFV